MDFIGMQFIARQIHPDLFSNLDPVAELARWHRDWLPVPLDGSWVASLA
jgi:hypothetical protein